MLAKETAVRVARNPQGIGWPNGEWRTSGELVGELREGVETTPSVLEG